MFLHQKAGSWIFEILWDQFYLELLPVVFHERRHVWICSVPYFWFTSKETDVMPTTILLNTLIFKCCNFKFQYHTSSAHACIQLLQTVPVKMSIKGHLHLILDCIS